MKKIEKLELPYDDGKGNFSSGSGEIHILRKVNEIIDVLNSWVFEPTLTIPSQSQKQPEKQEEWERELRFTYGHLYYQNEEGEFCQIVNEIDDLIDFISQLLSERTEEAYKSGYLECKKDLIKLIENSKALVECFNPISVDIRDRQEGELEAYNNILSKLLKEKENEEEKTNK